VLAVPILFSTQLLPLAVVVAAHITVEQQHQDLLAVLEAVGEVRAAPTLEVLAQPIKDMREALVLLVEVFTVVAVAVGLAESAVVDREHQTAELVFPHQLLAPLLHVAVAVAVVHITPTASSVLAVLAVAEQGLELREPQLLEQPILVVAVVGLAESAVAIVADCVEATVALVS